MGFKDVKGSIKISKFKYNNEAKKEPSLSVIPQQLNEDSLNQSDFVSLKTEERQLNLNSKSIKDTEESFEDSTNIILQD